MHLLAVCLALTIGSPANAAETKPPPDDLGPTSDVPWNPPRPISARRPWEQVLLLPGRVVTVPFTLLGLVSDHALVKIENGLITRWTASAPKQESSFGFKLRRGRLGDGSGYSGAVELHAHVLDGWKRQRLSAEVSASNRQYNRTVVTIAGVPGQTQYGYEWRPRERFYGVGMGSARDSLSDFSTQLEYLQGSFKFGWNRDQDTLAPRTVVMGWAGPRVVRTGRGHLSGVPPYDLLFPDVAATLDRRVENLIYGLSFSSDWRLGKPHWSQGWRVLMAAERFDRPIELLALADGSPHGAQFTRYTFETEAGFSFMRDPRTIRLLLRIMDQQVTSGREHFLISDMPKLGGRDAMTGFQPGRFRDLDRLHTKVSYIYPLGRTMEMDLHSEWAVVNGDLWRDTKFNTLANSMGAALRIRVKRPLASFGIDRSREQTRLSLFVGGVQ